MGTVEESLQEKSIFHSWYFTNEQGKNRWALILRTAISYSKYKGFPSAWSWKSKLKKLDVLRGWLRGWRLILPPNYQWKSFWLPANRPRRTSGFFGIGMEFVLFCPVSKQCISCSAQSNCECLTGIWNPFEHFIYYFQDFSIWALIPGECHWINLKAQNSVVRCIQPCVVEVICTRWT